MGSLDLPVGSPAPGWDRQAPRNRLLPEVPGERVRIVCLGGGTGLPAVLKGLARYARPKLGEPGVEIVALVAMSDDGGSSGRLRRARGLPPPGDIRNCLVALSGVRGPLTELFQYRFEGARGLAGHAVGNLLIAALAELKGDFLEAVRVTGRLLNARGTVLPSTLARVDLIAELEDSRKVTGERNILRARGRVRRVQLHPRSPPPTQGALEAIARADLITLGPGSLYSSVLPNLLVDGVADALRSSRALKVLIGNLMTQPGETDGMGCADHVRAVIDHVGQVMDVVLLNGSRPPQAALERYARKGARWIEADPDGLRQLGVIPVQADLLRPALRIRHDSGKLARCVLKLARMGV